MEAAAKGSVNMILPAVWIQISSFIAKSSKGDEEKKWRKEVFEREFTTIVNILQSREDAVLKFAMQHAFSNSKELTIGAYKDAMKFLNNEQNPYEKRIIAASIAVTICRRMNLDEKVPLDALFDLKELQTDIKHVYEKASYWSWWKSSQSARLRRVFLAFRIVYNNKEYKHDSGNSIGMDGKKILVFKHLRKIIIEKVKELRRKKYNFDVDKMGKLLFDSVEGLDDEISREFWLWWNQYSLQLDPARRLHPDDVGSVTRRSLRDLHKVSLSTNSFENRQYLAYTGCIYCGAMYNGMLIVPVNSNILLYNLKKKLALVFYEHPSCIERLHNCGIVLDRNRLLLVGGGENYASADSKVTVYDIKEKKLSTIPKMKHARCNPTVLLHENYLYVCGGDVRGDERGDRRDIVGLKLWEAFEDYFGERYKRKRAANNLIVEFYNFSSRKWNCTKPMSHGKQNPFMVLYKSKLYVFGSRKISLKREKLANTPPLEWYDFERKEWKSTASRTTLIKGVMKGVSTKRRDRYMDFQFGTNDTDHFISAAALKDKILLLTTVNPKKESFFVNLVVYHVNTDTFVDHGRLSSLFFDIKVINEAKGELEVLSFDGSSTKFRLDSLSSIYHSDNELEEKM